MKEPKPYTHHYWVDYVYIAFICFVVSLGGIIIYWEEICDFFK